jgi:urease accessory protein
MKREDFDAVRTPIPAAMPAADIEFACAGDGRTYLARAYAGYPYHVGRTLELPGDPPGMTSIYLQSCSGGLFEHERVSAQFTAREAALAHVATGASTIVHRMPHGHAEQSVHLFAGRNAVLEYLPEPTILFAGSRLRNRLSLQVAEGATCITGDAFLLHDPDAGDDVFDWFENTCEVRDENGALLVRDRQKVRGEFFLRPRPGVMGRWRVVGTLLFVIRSGGGSDLLEAVRKPLEAVPGLYAGASRLPNDCGLWVRLLAQDTIAMRAGWLLAWSAARTLLTGVTPRPRRR